MITRRTLIISTAALAAVSPLPAVAAGHEIQMLNKHPEDRRLRMVYHPELLVVQPGDTVKWVSADKGHNAKSEDGMIPDGVEAWKSKINDDFELMLEQPGIYGYRCTPHYLTGMVGLIIVEGDGKLDNLEAAKAVKHKGNASKSWDRIWSGAEEQGLLAASG